MAFLLSSADNDTRSDRVARMLSHHRQGSGDPLVLIHGIGHHAHGWDPVTRLLAEDFDVVATNTPGFGGSAPLDPLEPATLDRYVDAFEAFFAEAGLDRPHVAGNSMGGGIALELVRRKAVRSATAISPVGFWTPAERTWAQATLSLFPLTPEPLKPAMRAIGRGPLRGALTSLVFSRPTRLSGEQTVELLDGVWNAQEAFVPTLAAFDHYDFVDGDALRGTPVTIAWGTRDALLIAPTQMRRAKERLPWAHHVPLKGLGHTPFTDDPGMVAAVIRAGAARVAPAAV